MSTTPVMIITEIRTFIHSSSIISSNDGLPLKYSMSCMKVRTDISTNEVDKSIHDSLYLVIFINRIAMEAANIWSTIEMNRAIRRTICHKNLIYTKVGVYYLWLFKKDE